MYCTKCGKQIPDESTFCPECGNKCGENINEGDIKINISKPDIDTKKHGSYILAALKNPVTIMKEGFQGVTLKTNLIYVAVITLLIPIIKVLTLKIYSSSLVKSIMNLTNGIESRRSGFDQIFFNSRFNQMVDQIFPTGRIFITNLVSYILFYGIISLFIYLVYKFLIKENIENEKFVGILAVGSIVNLVLTIIASILLVVGAIPWLIVNAFSGIITIILLYVGFNNLVKGKNKLVYLFAFIYIVAAAISIWFTIDSVVSMITNISMMGIDDVLGNIL